MISDLSNVKLGDIIWTIQLGYTEVVKILDDKIRVIDKNTHIHYYFKNGNEYKQDEYPSAFVNIPACFINFKENDYVLVSNNKIDWEPSIFKYITKNNLYHVKVFLIYQNVFINILNLYHNKNHNIMLAILFLFQMMKKIILKGNFYLNVVFFIILKHQMV